jgi:hypothetical protein
LPGTPELRWRARIGNDALYGGSGDDVLYLKVGEVDMGDCGPGTDTVVSAETSEPFDQPVPGSEPYGNCEKIAMPIEGGQ